MTPLSLDQIRAFTPQDDSPVHMDDNGPYEHINALAKTLADHFVPQMKAISSLRNHSDGLVARRTNSFLRGVKTQEDIEFYAVAHHSDMQKHVFSTPRSMPFEVHSYRGIGDFHKIHEQFGSPGTQLELKGYTSSSLNPDKAINSFAHMIHSTHDVAQKHVVRFIHPKGPTSSIFGGSHTTNYPHEKEVVTNHNARATFQGTHVLHDVVRKRSYDTAGGLHLKVLMHDVLLHPASS